VEEIHQVGTAVSVIAKRYLQTNHFHLRKRGNATKDCHRQQQRPQGIVLGESESLKMEGNKKNKIKLKINWKQCVVSFP
jgi:hypothetical protein